MKRKPRSQAKKRPANDAGALASNIKSAPVRWMVDQDYLHKLSPSEREWLARFNDAHYGGDFRKWSKAKFPVEVRRQIWADLWSGTRADAIGMGNLGGMVDSLDRQAAWTDELERDPWTTAGDEDLAHHDHSATPAYLDDDAYRTARDNFRQHLDTSRRERPPEETPGYLDALRKLKKLTP